MWEGCTIISGSDAKIARLSNTVCHQQFVTYFVISNWNQPFPSAKHTTQASLIKYIIFNLLQKVDLVFLLWHILCVPLRICSFFTSKSPAKVPSRVPSRTPTCLAPYYFFPPPPSSRCVCPIMPGWSLDVGQKVQRVLNYPRVGGSLPGVKVTREWEFRVNALSEREREREREK